MIVLSAALTRGPSGPRLVAMTSEGERVVDLSPEELMILEAGAAILRARLLVKVRRDGALLEDQVAAESVRLARDLAPPVPEPTDG